MFQLALPLCFFLLIAGAVFLLNFFARRFSRSVRDEFSEHVARLEREILELREELRRTKRESADAETPTAPKADESVPAREFRGEPPPLPVPAKATFPQHENSVPAAERADGNVAAPDALSFSEKLREWKILPPRGMSAEILIMRWYAPRVGGVLALLALIFFGVWAAQFSSAPVKLAEMTAAALGVAALGVWCRQKKNLSLGNPLTATGTTMFYLTALAAGAFPPTKIFDSVPPALCAQLAAILPTLLLGRGRNTPVILGAAFAFVSAMFAVLNGAGTAALVTALTAYAVAAWLCRRRNGNALGVLLAGAVGTYLPLWAMNFPEGDEESFGVPEAFLAKGAACIAFFVIAGSIVPAMFRKKEETRLTNFIQAGNLLHAFAATACALEAFGGTWIGTKHGILDWSYGNLAYALFFSVVAGTAFAWAAAYLRRAREKSSFAFQYFLSAGTLAVPLAILYWFNESPDSFEAIFYVLLAESLLLAFVGRQLKARLLFAPLALCLLGANTLISRSVALSDCVPHAFFDGLPDWAACALLGAVMIFSVGMFFGDAKLWSGRFSKKAACAAGALAGLIGAAQIMDFASGAFAPWLPTTIGFVAAFVLCAAGSRFPRFSKIPFLVGAGTVALNVFYWAIEITFNHFPPLSPEEVGCVIYAPFEAHIYAPLSGTLITLIAVPALKFFVKNETRGRIAELCFVVPTLIFLAKHFSNYAELMPTAAVFALAALPLAALAAGTAWRENSRAFPLTRRTADVSALPLVVAFFAANWRNVPAAPIFLLLPVFAPFCFSATRKILRERHWIAGTLTAAGAACLLAACFETFPRFLSAASGALAFALIAAGFFARIRAVRVVGIVLLAGTLGRLFIFDIGETVWRIAAFAGVSVALFILGALYRRKK